VDEERPDHRAVQVPGSDQIFAGERHVDVDRAVDDLARAGELERLVVTWPAAARLVAVLLCMLYRSSGVM
jgi:hypothetical protein